MRCVSDEVEPRREWTRGSHIDWKKGTSVSENNGLRRGWTVRSHINWGGEQNIVHKSVGSILLSSRVLKTLKLENENRNRIIFCNGPDPPLVDIVLFKLLLSGFPSRL